jgi:SAM-dependent methyltransferase
LDEFRPYLGKRLVEVGAGTGDFSKMLLEERPETLTLIEPSGMFETLSTAIALVDKGSAKVRCIRSTFAEANGELCGDAAPDSIIYVNVLEHIENDEAELKLVYDVLAPGGRCFIFVPAMPSLYGPFDKKIGHFRRYTKPELERKCIEAGFQIVASRYFDLSGILPWWIKYRLLRSQGLDPRSVRLYDRAVVPLASRIERRVHPIRGKNILCIAERE